MYRIRWEKAIQILLHSSRKIHVSLSFSTSRSVFLLNTSRNWEKSRRRTRLGGCWGCAHFESPYYGVEMQFVKVTMSTGGNGLWRVLHLQLFFFVLCAPSYKRSRSHFLYTLTVYIICPTILPKSELLFSKTLFSYTLSFYNTISR